MLSKRQAAALAVGRRPASPSLGESVMAKVVFGGGPSLILSNFFFAELDGEGGKKAFDAVVEDAIGGADSGRISFKGLGFKFSDGNPTAGRVEEIVYRGELGRDSGVSMTITGLDVKAADLFSLGDFNSATLAELVSLLFGGDDTVRGGRAGDVAYPGAGTDGLALGGGNDTVVAGAGSDKLNGGKEDVDSVFSRDGDKVNYALMTGAVDADLDRGTAIKPNGTDRLIDIEGLLGSAFNDTLKGDDENNTFLGGAGSDVIDGRGGVDIAIFDHLENGVLSTFKVDLAKGRAVDQSGVTDKLKNVEGAFGGFGNDTILGGDGDDILSGGIGGQDVLTGRKGADDFVFARPGVSASTATTITDFNSGEDHLAIDRAAFGVGNRFDLVIDDGEPGGDLYLVPTFVLSLSDDRPTLLFYRKGDVDGATVAFLNGVEELSKGDFLMF
jgi:Ca2+-binding RTX toxin-like protein